jgi:hypothetical protein
LILLPERCFNTFEHYQISKGSKIIYDQKAKTITEFHINGDPLELDKLYRVGIQTYHFNNLDKFLGLDMQIILAQGKPTTLCTSLTNVIEEAFMTSTNLKSKLEGRIQRINLD